MSLQCSGVGIKLELGQSFMENLKAATTWWQITFLQGPQNIQVLRIKMCTALIVFEAPTYQFKWRWLWQ